MSKPKALFYPAYELPESDTFEIPLHGQVTVTAMGLYPGDKVTFELVFTPAVQPDMCACPPGHVEMPSVAASTPLMCCGTQVAVTIDQPYVILDAPQGMRVRAVLDAQSRDGVWVWAQSTGTAGVNDRMRGCCETSQEPGNNQDGGQV